MINGSFNLIFHVYSPVLNDEVDRLWPFEVILFRSISNENLDS